MWGVFPLGSLVESAGQVPSKLGTESQQGSPGARGLPEDTLERDCRSRETSLKHVSSLLSATGSRKHFLDAHGRCGLEGARAYTRLTLLDDSSLAARANHARFPAPSSHSQR